jgi:hypothetical protein
MELVAAGAGARAAQHAAAAMGFLGGFPVNSDPIHESGGAPPHMAQLEAPAGSMLAVRSTLARVESGRA